MSHKRKSLLKVLILGDSGVGKTSIMNRWITEKYSEQYKATIGADFLTKEVMIENNLVSMQIWDTAGQERFATLGVAFYRGADAVILVYDVTNKESFKHLEKWKEDFLDTGKPKMEEKYPFIVFGNKSDLPAHKKKVYKNEVNQWCNNNNNIPFFEVSAKENYNIEQGFVRIAKLALDYNKNIGSDLDLYKYDMDEMLNGF
eukprot:UN06461